MSDISAQLRKAQQGDKAAYRDFLKAVQPLLNRYFRSRVRVATDVDDLVQQTLLRVHNYRHTYQPGKQAEPWVYTIAKNVLFDHYKMTSKHAAQSIDAEFDGWGSEEQGAESYSMLQEALDKMPASLCDAFILVKLEGKVMEEAAKQLGISLSAVKVRAFRAYKFLDDYVGA